MKAKKIIALLLSLVMIFTCIPVSAFAGGVRTREAFIETLAAEYGREKAEKIFASMMDMGLIDGDGNRVIHKIEFEGKEYTVDQIKEIVESPDTDLSKEVKVDGDVITIADIREML